MEETIDQKLAKKVEELRAVIADQKVQITALTKELSEAKELIAYINSKDRTARDNLALAERIKRLNARFRDTAGAMEKAIKLAIDPTVDDLSTIVLPEPMPELLMKRYLG